MAAVAAVVLVLAALAAVPLLATDFQLFRLTNILVYALAPPLQRSTRLSWQLPGEYLISVDYRGAGRKRREGVHLCFVQAGFFGTELAQGGIGLP